MKVMIFDVPAESGGALSILMEYYNKAVKEEKIEWIFIISKPALRDRKNIKVINYPWIKKGWFFRIIFDFIYAPRLIKKYKPNEVYSLQNLIIPIIGKKYKQILYIHQSLPFSEYKFKFKENRLFWFYQNIYGKLINCSIKKADEVIVQSEWMKKACIEETRENSEKFRVMPPVLDIQIQEKFTKTYESMKTFFYPAASSYYKNHRVIIEACHILRRKGIFDYKVILTLDGNENEHISSLYDTVKKENLPISFVGNLTRSEVFEYYSKSILVFPSYIESSPVPLTEGKKHDTLILASDSIFSKEILNDYKDVFYFKWDDSFELANQMLNCIQYNSTS